jgi:hypothetical protein
MSIVYHATARIKGIENKFDEAQLYMNLYTNSVTIMRDRINAKPNYTPGIRVK